LIISYSVIIFYILNVMLKKVTGIVTIPYYDNDTIASENELVRLSCSRRGYDKLLLNQKYLCKE